MFDFNSRKRDYHLFKILANDDEYIKSLYREVKNKHKFGRQLIQDKYEASKIKPLFIDVIIYNYSILQNTYSKVSTNSGSCLYYDVYSLKGSGNFRLLTGTDRNRKLKFEFIKLRDKFDDEHEFIELILNKKEVKFARSIFKFFEERNDMKAQFIYTQKSINALNLR